MPRRRKPISYSLNSNNGNHTICGYQHLFALSDPGRSSQDPGVLGTLSTGAEQPVPDYHLRSRPCRSGLCARFQEVVRSFALGCKKALTPSPVITWLQTAPPQKLSASAGSV